MMFKLKSKNPYKNLVKYLPVILASDKTPELKMKLVEKLYSLLDFSDPNKYLYIKILYNGRLFGSFETDSYSDKLPKTIHNPWLLLQLDIKEALEENRLDRIEIAYLWFERYVRKEDWIR